ncbi:MAG: radical SAM protein, partial [Victivallaceae bacterium]
MNIRGIRRFSLVDFPGKMACVVFVGDCNFRCAYCHNPCLVFDPESQPLISEDEFFGFLEKRRGKLDGVVISGGEPTLQKNLLPFVKKIKAMDFLVKLDTNGSLPEKVFAIH